MAVLDRAKLTADRKTYANRALRYRGAVQVKSPVSDYPEEPNETHYRLLLADTRFGRLATINKAERLLDKFLADDRTNPRRRDEDGTAYKFRLWRIYFPPPEMVNTPATEPSTTLAESPTSPSSTDPSPVASPTFSPPSEWASECDSPTSMPPSPLVTEPEVAAEPLPQWSEFLSRKEFSRAAAWALSNYQGVKVGRVKPKDAPNPYAWEMARMLEDSDREKLYWQTVAAMAQKFDAQIEDEERKRQAETEKKLQKRADDDRDLSGVFERLEKSGYGSRRPLSASAQAAGREPGVPTMAGDGGAA